jgi:hypothetical protein
MPAVIDLRMSMLERTSTVLVDGLVVGMVAIHHVRGHEPVKESRDNLDPEETPNKTGHHYEARLLIVKATSSEVAHRRRQHTVQRRENLI